MRHVLVADDDGHIREVVCFALKRAGYDVTACADGRAALAAFRDRVPDILVLDIGMPETDGLAVCREIRRDHDTPILFLSARNEEIDRVLGLELGGDDYVTKPFSPRELVARVAAILKRTAPASTGPGGGEVLRVGALALDADERRVAFAGATVPMTAIEFAILRTLMARPSMVFTRDRIMELAWPDNIHVSDRTIDSHIRNIRSKLASTGCGEALVTVHGMGFRMGECGKRECGSAAPDLAGNT